MRREDILMKGLPFKVFVWFGWMFLVSAPTALAAGKISIFVSIPPQKYHVEKIGGERVAVSVMADPGADWERPALTTDGRLNHALRSDHWRYIRYADGSEELYDHDSDPMEYTNLADRVEYESVKRGLSKWLPKENAPDAPKQK